MSRKCGGRRGLRSPRYTSGHRRPVRADERGSSSRVTTPKLPPPPRRPQRSSAFSSALALDDGAVGNHELGATMLSHVRPCWAVRWPMPPPRVSPVTPVEPTTPPGVTRPNACVAGRSRARSRPLARNAIRASGSTDTPRMPERSITRPSSQTQCPAGLWPPPRTATSSSWPARSRERLRCPRLPRSARSPPAGYRRVR